MRGISGALTMEFARLAAGVLAEGILIDPPTFKPKTFKTAQRLRAAGWRR